MRSSLVKSRPARWWALAAWVPVAVGIVRFRKPLRAPRPLSALTAASAPVAFALISAPGRRRAVGIWILQMWAYKVVFELPHDDPGAHRRRLRIDYPIAADGVLGGGVPVTQRLQSKRSAPITRLDKLVAGFYLTWDVEPHGALAWLLIRHPERFPRAAALLGATIDLTLIGYWLVPTAPPWWASRVAGRMDGEVHRVFTETRRVVRGQPRETGNDTRGANPWASMPSDHLASSAMTAMLLAEVGAAPGAIAGAYAIALGLALLYLGEHYLVDLLAGLGVAGMTWALEPVARGPLEFAAGAIERAGERLRTGR